MSIGLRLDLRQTQQLVMTPQLQQAIRLLAMSNIELSEFVETELEKNPLLKLEEPARGSGEALPDAPVNEPTRTAADRTTDDHDLMRRTFDTGTENLVDTSPSDGPCPLGRAHRVSGGARGDGPDLAERLAAPTDLRAHLIAQIGLMPRARGTVGLIARYMVEELDDHGYLRTGVEEIAQRLGTDPGVVEAALRLVQACEPTGVGARNLAECFALQLAERDRLDPMMQSMLDHLHLLGRGDLRQLQARTGADDEDFADMLNELRDLDPRPCKAHGVVEPETLIPDVLLKRTDWGGFQIELNPETLPRVLVDRDYRAVLNGADCEKTREYLTECHANAAWLVKSMDQRARTILRVATEIVRRQERFFEEGISALQPLTLREVAEAIDMHESTASRVTSNKYMATNRGILELKFFFTNSVGGTEGGSSATAVRHRIKALVAAESETGVLSDDAIVESLRSDGIDIARRTVAKYRKSLNIPSSVDRRRQLAVASKR